MTAVFINDHPFFVDTNSKVYTSGTLTSDVWSRFTDNFGALTVIGRGVKIGSSHHKHKSADADYVRFDLFYNVVGGVDYITKRKEIEKRLLPYILDSEFIILRLPSSLGLIASAICRKLKKRYLVEVVGCAFDSLWYMGRLKGKVVAPFNAYRTRTAIHAATAAVYVTSEYLQKKYPNPSYQINASNVEIENFPKNVLTNHLKHLERLDSTTIFGMIGNISLPYKGFEVLFRALSMLDNTDYVLEIVGGGDDRWIKNLIRKYRLEDRVLLKGRINDRVGIYQFLDKLDIYIQPSLTEGLPRSVIEAMSRACPVVVSDAGGNPELISSRMVYAKRSPRALCNLLDRSMRDKTLLSTLSRQNFTRSKQYEFNQLKQKRYNFLNEIKLKLLNR